MGFDVHEGIDSVVGFRIPGENVSDLVTIPEQSVNSTLEHGIVHNVLLHGLVAGVENTNPFSESPVELVRADSFGLLDTTSVQLVKRAMRPPSKNMSKNKEPKSNTNSFITINLSCSKSLDTPWLAAG